VEPFSIGLHLDYMRKFFGDPDAAETYEITGCSRDLAWRLIGFGYEFASSSVFFTYTA